MVVTSINNEVTGEETSIISSLIYSNESSINKGTYTQVVTLPEITNYVFTSTTTS